jgi:hypothetical protein
MLALTWMNSLERSTPATRYPFIRGPEPGREGPHSGLRQESPPVLVAIREDEARLEAQPQPPVAEQAVAELYPLLTAA